MIASLDTDLQDALFVRADEEKQEPDDLATEVVYAGLEQIQDNERLVTCSNRLTRIHVNLVLFIKLHYEISIFFHLEIDN